jgi:hypothetical protein
MSRVQALVVAFLLALGVTGVAFAASARHAVSKVTVTFTDRTIRATPMTPGSGPTTFFVLNKGKKPHMLMVKGPGVRGAHTTTLAAGKSAQLSVTLRPGAYVLSDPIGLGAYNVLFLDVVKSASLTAKGDANVVTPTTETPPMCGIYP